MFVLNVRILGRDLSEDFMKQTVGKFHNVVFSEAGDLLAIVAASIFKCVAHNLFRSWARNNLQTLHDLIGLAVLNARVQILFILADDHDVHARMLRLDERMIRNAGPHVRVKSERFAHGHVQALVASTLRRRNRSFQENFCVAQ